jgi:hypothetical protein
VDFSRSIRFFDAKGRRLEFGDDWGVYDFPDGQNQIWFEREPADEEICLNHPAILDLLVQTLAAVGALNVFVTYLYGARSDKVRSGSRRVANVALHSRALVESASVGKRLEIFVPHDSQQHSAPFRFEHDLSAYDGIVFPDASAKSRQPWTHQCGMPELTFEKVRKEETGDIIGLAPSRTVSCGRHLVIDDICDGGATFLKVAEMLPGCEFDLFVPHGIFSGSALDRLSQAGYSQIFTTNSFVHDDPALEAEIAARCSVANIWRSSGD